MAEKKTKMEISESELRRTSEGPIDTKHIRKSASLDKNDMSKSQKAKTIALSAGFPSQSVQLTDSDPNKSLTYLNKIPDAVKNICVALSP